MRKVVGSAAQVCRCAREGPVCRSQALQRRALRRAASTGAGSQANVVMVLKQKRSLFRESLRRR